MASWGTRYIGIRKEISPSDYVTKGSYYEAVYTTPVDIPDDIELTLLTAFRGLSDKVSGQRTNYIYVKGRTVIIQWYAEHASPLSVETVLTAITIIAVAYAVTMVLSAVYQIVSIVGPEVVGMFLQMMMMFFMMTMITRFTEFLPRRRR